MNAGEAMTTALQEQAHADEDARGKRHRCCKCGAEFFWKWGKPDPWPDPSCNGLIEPVE